MIQSIPNKTKSIPPSQTKQNNLQLFPLILDWKEAGPLKKFYLVLCAPLHLILAITVPLVEHIESEEIRKTEYFSWWSKHLLALNLFIDPLFIAWATGGIGNLWGGFPVWGFCLLLGIVVALACLLFAEEERPPRFYQVLAPLSFLTSVLWIYFFAGELVALIGVIGIVFGVSETLLGLTVLAWGNSIGDLISNTTMAKLGFANMGVSACFGSPLLSTFSSLASLLISNAIKQTNQTIKQTINQTINQSYRSSPRLRAQLHGGHPADRDQHPSGR